MTARRHHALLRRPWKGSPDSQGGPGAVLPSLPRVADLRMYFDSRLGVSTSGAEVTSWDDQAGNYDATDPATLNRPTLIMSDANFNGAPTIDFVRASSQGLDLPGISEPAQEFTTLTVTRDTGARSRILDFGGTVFRVSSRDGGDYRFRVGGTNYLNNSMTTDVVETRTFVVRTVTSDHYLGRVSQLSGAIPLTAFSSAAGCLGCQLGASTNGMNGQIGLIAMWNVALSASEHTEAWDFANSIWGNNP